MTYEDALKASENGQNVRLWTGEEYLHPEYVKQTLDNLSTVQISHERLRSLLKASVSDDWEIYTKESLEWETGYYRKRYERLNHIQNDFLKDKSPEFRGFSHFLTIGFFRKTENTSEFYFCVTIRFYFRRINHCLSQNIGWQRLLLS